MVTIQWGLVEYPEQDVVDGAIDLGTDNYGVLDNIDLFNSSSEPMEPGVGSVWLKWTSQSLAITSFFFDFGDQDMTATLFVDGVELDEQTGVTVSLTANVNEGSEVLLRIATLTGGGAASLAWSQAPQPVAPAALAQYIRVEVFTPDGETLISEVPRRIAPSGQAPLNGVGSGEFSIPASDPILEAYPDLLRYRNIVRFWLGNKCIHAIRIRTRSIQLVNSSENAGMIRTISGPSVENLLADMIVRHDGPPRPDSQTTRRFDWSSRDNGAKVAWHRLQDWNRNICDSQFLNPPGNNWTDKGDEDTAATLGPAKERDKYGLPKGWPDTSAKWMFAHQRSPLNRRWGVNMSLSAEEWRHRYYRKTLYISESMTVRVCASADYRMNMYLDGEMILENQARGKGYETYVYTDIDIEEGWHTFAAEVHAAEDSKTLGDGSNSFLCTVMRLKNGRPPVTGTPGDGPSATPAFLLNGDIILHSSQTWQAFYGRDVPGWNEAQVLRCLILEAADRGVEAAEILSDFNFTPTNDYYGDAWPQRKFNKELDIGANGSDVARVLSEGGGFDIWVDPRSLRLCAAKRRGRDVSASVRLEPGRNLMDWSAEGTDEVYNTFLVRTSRGWFNFDMKGSQESYGRTEAVVDLGKVSDESQARRIMSAVARGVAWARNRTGVADSVQRSKSQPQGSVVAVHGAQPFIDFGVGDIISAMNEDGVFVRQRVLGLSFTESENVGEVYYEPTLGLLDGSE